MSWIPSGFVRPWVLWFLVAPVLLLFWIWNRKSRGVALPVDHSPHARGTATKVLINMAESIAPILLAIVIWILAGPMELGRPIAQRSMTNIQFCVDISGSMQAPFGDGSRYDASMAAINQFLDFREGDAFGLTFFGNSVLHWCPLTTDSSAIRCSIPFMRPEVVPVWFGGTEIGKALKECQTILNQQESGDKMIILVSDGQSADLFGGRSQSLARELYNDNIHVYAIHVAEGGAPPDITTITTYTEGEVFAPEDPSSLEAVFRQIDAMEKAELEKTIAEQLDNFKPYSLVALVLLTVIIGCSYGLRYTPW
ncbi:MAG: vWA domain-containing protein [Planctomycetota bacterium]